MTAAPVAPPRPTYPKNRCAAGVTPCGAKGRLYTCGVRCPEHAPNTRHLRRKPATNQKDQP